MYGFRVWPCRRHKYKATKHLRCYFRILSLCASAFYSPSKSECSLQASLHPNEAALTTFQPKYVTIVVGSCPMEQVLVQWNKQDSKLQETSYRKNRNPIYLSLPLSQSISSMDLRSYL